MKRLNGERLNRPLSQMYEGDLWSQCSKEHFHGLSVNFYQTTDFHISMLEKPFLLRLL
jgi:hypothetical protein